MSVTIPPQAANPDGLPAEVLIDRRKANAADLLLIANELWEMGKNETDEVLVALYEGARLAVQHAAEGAMHSANLTAFIASLDEIADK